MTSHLSIIHSKWHHYFHSLQFSTQEFYALVEAKLREEQIKGVKVQLITYHEEGLFSPKRAYLRIKRRELIFDICAAPFGKGFFVSWWHGESLGIILNLVGLIPFIGPFILRIAAIKSFYRMDTDQMFKEVVKNSVQSALSEITASKGVKGLTELERMDSAYSK